jgi:hypothetical protein
MVTTRAGYASLLLLALLPAVHSAPHTKTVKTSRPPQRFDRSLQRIPLDFIATDFTALFEANRIGPKGEYETSDQYRDRMKSASDGSYYAFSLNPLTTKYDADRQVFEVTIQAEELQPEAFLALAAHDLEGVGGRKVIVIKEGTAGKLKQYVGSNAFGVKVKVTRRNAAQDAVVLKHAITDVVGFKSIQIPVPLDRARGTKLAFLLVFKLEPAEGAGLTMTATGYREPTIDLPIEVVTTSRYVFVDDVAVWTYDKSTGEVLDKTTVP